MNILRANIDSNKIKFEGIEVDVPNHLNNVKDKNFNLGYELLMKIVAIS